MLSSSENSDCTLRTTRAGDHGAVLQIGRSLVRSQLVSVNFFIDINSFRSHYGPGVDSACDRNEYQEYFLVVKRGRCVSLTTYHHPVPLSRSLGTLTSWNPPGPSGVVTGLLFTTRRLHWTTNFKKFFVSVMNMLLIYLFASVKLEKAHKNCLALVLKLCCHYDILRNSLR